MFPNEQIKSYIFQVTTKHLHLDLFVDFQQKVSKVLDLPFTPKWKIYCIYHPQTFV